jgi:hypothetical protein
MLTFWGVVAGLTSFAGLPLVGGLWMFERRRSRRRNRSGECATCGSPWKSVRSGDPYLIHGRLVCEGCAETARRRLPWHFAILGSMVAAVALGVAMAEGGLTMAILLPIGSTAAMTFGAVQLMKLANRNAQRRIAAGEFPDLEGLALPEVSDGGGGAPPGGG